MKVLAILLKFCFKINLFLFFRWFDISFTFTEATTNERKFGRMKIHALFCSVPFMAVKKQLLSEGVVLKKDHTVVILNVFKYPMFYIEQ